MITIFEVSTFEQESALADAAELLQIKHDFLEEDEGFGIMIEATSANAENIARLMSFWGKQLAPKSHKRKAQA